MVVKLRMYNIVEKFFGFIWDIYKMFERKVDVQNPTFGGYILRIDYF